MKDEYLKAAAKIITNPNILVNLVRKRVIQLANGAPALIESLEHLTPEDIALREIIEGKIEYELWDASSEESHA